MHRQPQIQSLGHCTEITSPANIAYFSSVVSETGKASVQSRGIILSQCLEVPKIERLRHV